MSFMTVFIALVALNAVDVLLTQKILSNGGREINPLMAKAMDKVGVIPALLGIKIPVLVAVWWFTPPLLWLQFFVGIYIAVVGNNAYQLYRQRGK